MGGWINGGIDYISERDKVSENNSNMNSGSMNEEREKGKMRK